MGTPHAWSAPPSTLPPCSASASGTTCTAPTSTPSTSSWLGPAGPTWQSGHEPTARATGGIRHRSGSVVVDTAHTTMWAAALLVAWCFCMLRLHLLLQLYSCSVHARLFMSFLHLLWFASLYCVHFPVWSYILSVPIGFVPLFIWFLSARDRSQNGGLIMDQSVQALVLQVFLLLDQRVSPFLLVGFPVMYLDRVCRFDLDTVVSVGRD